LDLRWNPAVKRAIVSDIHGNAIALGAVLEDIIRQNCDEVYCLGDIVGYGPEPRDCVDYAMEFAACILGNHDQGVLVDPEGFSSGAERAIFWTRAQLQQSCEGNGAEHDALSESQQKRWNFLCELPRVIREGDVLYVHGSARFPLSEYVFPEDVLNRKKIYEIFEFIPSVCFQGHTHVPGIFTESCEFKRPDEVTAGYDIGGKQKLMINVGSVGQPRDGDPRACYVTLEDGVIRFHRVEYAVEVVASKIHAITELDQFLGDRLLQGR
jgi:predicted phosphodiesterase